MDHCAMIDAGDYNEARYREADVHVLRVFFAGSVPDKEIKALSSEELSELSLEAEKQLMALRTAAS